MSITEAVEAARPIYTLGRHHGYRQALEDLITAMEVREVRYSEELRGWLEGRIADQKACIGEHHVG